MFFWICSEVANGHPHFVAKTPWIREAKQLFEDYNDWRNHDYPEAAYILGTNDEVKMNNYSIEAYQERFNHAKIFNERAKRILKVRSIIYTISIFGMFVPST